MSKEVVTTDTRKRKDKYNAKVARFRPVKNLLLWLSGVVSGLILLVIALVVLPVGTIMGLAGMDASDTIGEENGKKSIYGFVTGIKDMTIDDVPAIQKAIEEFTSAIPQFNDFTEVEEGETVDPAAEDFVPALYYYKTESGEFLRAFDNDKNYVQGVTATTKLYYAKLSAVAVSDLSAVLPASFRSMKVVDLISAVSGDDDMTGSIAKILEDTKVSELGDFDINGVKLSAVLTGEKDEEGNDKGISEQLKKLLADLAGAEYEEITIGSLTSDFNVDNVHLSSVIENNEENATIVKLLTEAIGGEGGYDDITVADFASLDFAGVKLSTVLGDESELDANLLSILKDATGGTEYADMTVKNLTSGLSFDSVHLSAVLGDMDDNSDLVKILKDATGKDSFSSITVNDLKALETNNVKLSSVLPVEGNGKIYEILLSGYVLGEGEIAPTEETLTIGGLSNFSIDGVKLSAVLEYTGNEKIYDILAQGSDYVGDKKDITILSIQNFNPDNIKLSSVLELPTAENAYANEKIYKILLQGTGAERYEDISISSLSGLDTGNIALATVLGDRTTAGDKLAGILEDCAGKNYAEITVSDLAGLDTDNIKLSSVLDYDSNQNIFNILAEGADGYSGDVRNIKISDINGFNVSKVKLKTVIPSSSNKILSVLLADESVTVGNAGDKINTLKVSDIYGDTKCFVENAAGTGKYYKLIGTGTETFVLTSAYNPAVDGEREGKTYDISSESGVWFFMFYTREGASASGGYGKKYTATDISFGEMESKVKEVSQSVQNATIRELVSCGLVDDPEFDGENSENLYAMTLHKMFEMVKAFS